MVKQLFDFSLFLGRLGEKEDLSNLMVALS